VVSRSYVIGLPVIVTVEDGPPWETGPRVRWEVDTSEAAREVERSDDSGYTEEEERADAATIREWIERHPTVASVVEAIGGNPWDAKLRADLGLVTDEEIAATGIPVVGDRPPECVCGGDIELIGGQWFHSRIEDGSHQAEPK
jgi:hypothetical protein